VLLATTHIGRMLRQAADMAEGLDGAGVTDKSLRALERASNLARHASAELDDERLRGRDGWEFV
jgi:hypothetical protein